MARIRRVQDDFDGAWNTQVTFDFGVVKLLDFANRLDEFQHCDNPFARFVGEVLAGVLYPKLVGDRSTASALLWHYRKFAHCIASAHESGGWDAADAAFRELQAQEPLLEYMRIGRNQNNKIDSWYVTIPRG